VSLFYFFAGAKVTVRTNEDAVNSVFMVQVKKNEQGLSQINLVRKNLGEVLLKRVESWFSARNLFGKDNLTAQAGGISTEGAQEMQKRGWVFLHGLALARSGS